MLENQVEFNQAVDTLLDAQTQSIASSSIAGGEHLCFIGSGHDEEDKYVHMVVANFLQRKKKYISIALGGYDELSKLIDDPNSIIETKTLIATNQDDEFNRTSFTEDWIKKVNMQQKNKTSIFNTLSNVVKTKSFDIKDKFKDYMTVANQKTAGK
jgi:hypothetical protein